jgi:hypothetical protein
VYVTTLNPALALTLTVDVIVPLVLDVFVPCPAFQAQVTMELPKEVHPAVDEILNPSAINDVGEPDVVDSAAVKFELKPFVIPRTESCK